VGTELERSEVDVGGMVGEEVGNVDGVLLGI